MIVHLKVQDASGNTTQFKIKTATALKKLMSTYCERNGLDVQVFFFYMCLEILLKNADDEKLSSHHTLPEHPVHFLKL